MRNGNKSWLQLYVDAMTERNPYKRLALVRELRRMPREQESEQFLADVIEDRIRNPRAQTRKSKTTKTRKRRSTLQEL